MLEDDERSLIRRYWALLVRRDLPRHTRAFQSFHRKRAAEARKYSEQCQREVKTRVTSARSTPSTRRVASGYILVV